MELRVISIGLKDFFLYVQANLLDVDQIEQVLLGLIYYVVLQLKHSSVPYYRFYILFQVPKTVLLQKSAESRTKDAL